MSQLSDRTITGIKGWLAALAAGKPGFQRRREQDRAIHAIARALESEDEDARRLIALEGPTGIGKSIAYLIAGMVAAERHGRTLIVSTATVALQQQLAADLAAIAGLGATPVRTAIVKGRARYLCDRNLASLSGEDPDQLGLDLGDSVVAGQWPWKPTAEEQEAVGAMRAARRTREWDGDFDVWQRHLSARLRPLLTTTSKGCAGAGCPYATGCGLLRARRSIRDSEVVVVNHAMLLADQREGGGGAILPPLEESILIVDEAHHLPDVAVEAQAGSVVLAGHAKRLRHAMEVIERAGAVRAKVLGASAADRLAEAERDTASALDALARVVTPLLPASEASVAAGRRYGRVFGAATTARLHPHSLDGMRSDLELGASRAKVLLDQVEREKEKLTKEPPAGAGSGMVSRIVRELGDASSWLQSCHDTLVLLSSDDDEADAPVARWLTRDPQGVVEVHASPVDASAWLAGHVWRKAFGAVAVSATLRAMGDFRHFAERSGLRRLRETAYVALPSLFDLEQPALLRMPATILAPVSEDACLAKVMFELSAGVGPSELTRILRASPPLMDALVERASASRKH